MAGKNRSITGWWAGIILVIGVFIYWSHLYNPQTLEQLVKSDSAHIFTSNIEKEKVSVQLITEYSKCGHSLPHGKKEFTSDELLQLIEDNPDFKIQEAGDNVMVISTEHTFCPTDEQKRTLGIAGDYLAIFKGPAHLNEEIEKITQIRVEQLPEYWRELLSEGSLEFNDEISLLEALDSLDEYQTQNP